MIVVVEYREPIKIAFLLNLTERIYAGAEYDIPMGWGWHSEGWRLSKRLLHRSPLRASRSGKQAFANKDPPTCSLTIC